MTKVKKMKKQTKSAQNGANEEIPTVREMTEEEVDKPNNISEEKWVNKQRVLVLACRGLSFRDRHLMKDLIGLMPHSKTESKMRRGDSLYSANEMAEMKNCNKCFLFEGRKKRDLYFWMADVGRGPSAKFQVENVHTAGELKLTGNCLKGSRPLLSFDMAFGNRDQPHLQVLKEMFIQTFGVPKGHPKSQPFFDRVYTFSLIDDKIWFRHYQILPEEDGSLAEVGPRFVLNPIKIFAASFSGQTLWENPKYVTPAASRAIMKKKAGKYLRHVESKAAYEASRPKGSTYKVDETDVVFNTLDTDSEAEEAFDDTTAVKDEGTKKRKAKPNKFKRKKLKMAKEEQNVH